MNKIEDRFRSAEGDVGDDILSYLEIPEKSKIINFKKIVAEKIRQIYRTRKK